MKKLFTTILAVTAVVAGVSAQSYLSGIKKPIQIFNDKAPGDTIVAYPPAVDTCQSTDLLISPYFGTATLPPPISASVTAVGQKFSTELSSILAVGAYIQLIGTQSLTPYQINVNATGATPGTSLGNGTLSILDTLNANSGVYYAVAFFSSPVAVANGDFYITGTTVPTAAGDTIRYLLNDCASANSFLASGATWMNTAAYGLSNDVAFEVLGIEGGGNSGIQESFVTATNVMPNPTSGNATLVYNIKENATVNVKVMNLAGQVVKQINEGTKAAGTYATTLNMSDLAAGTYIYQINANGFTTTGRIVVAK